MIVPRRRIPARVGIAALNLLLPGLGLQRLGDRRALYFLLLVPVLLALTLAYYALGPELDFIAYAIVSLALLVSYFSAMVAAIALSWRRSRDASARPWWSRWYAIVAAYAAVTLVGWVLVPRMHAYYKPFYIPSEAMAPTLLPNDRLVASMQGAGQLSRGEIILLDVNGHIYIKRVAALPGDRIAMVDGVVVLNGSPVRQRLVAIDRVPISSSGDSARRLSEQFPGEAAPHEIYDSGHSDLDDMAERVVQPDHVFVLGDNRDHSADSRVSRTEWGVEQLPIGDIRGRALFRTWGPSGKMGERLNG